MKTEIDNPPVMDAETLEALKLSIEKWERFANGTARDGDTIFGKSCPLCKLFNSMSEDRFDKSCVGCPVSRRTGKPECEGSPWLNAKLALFKKAGIGDPDSPEFLAAARAEADFLKSLLPNPTTP